MDTSKNIGTMATRSESSVDNDYWETGSVSTIANEFTDALIDFITNL